MDTPDKVALISFSTVVIGSITGMFLGLAMTDDTTWEQLPDPDCYMKVHTDNSLFGRDITTRELYCKENNAG